MFMTKFEGYSWKYSSVRDGLNGEISPGIFLGISMEMVLAGLRDGYSSSGVDGVRFGPRGQ